MRSPGKAILECPSCGQSLLNIGSRVERIDPLPRFIDDHYFKLLIFWSFFIPIPLLFTTILGEFVTFLMIMLVIVPIFGLYVVKRSYPLYRVTECPYCGHREALKLGHSQRE